MNTEKARSEFMIAPILLELRRLVGEHLGIFSGVPLEGDSSRGLDGFCDFLLTTSGMQLMVRGPIVAVVEAKNDNIMNGLGQCIASLVAVRMFNEREGSKDRTVYGVVTTGSAWKFMKHLGSELATDRQGYSIRDPGKLLAILTAMVA